MRLSSFRLSDYCCQATEKRIDPYAFDPDSLIIARRGKNILRFSPLGNNPSEPTLALVGITPGSQFLMVDGSYAYKAPDISASPEAKFCVCNRFVADVTK